MPAPCAAANSCAAPATLVMGVAAVVWRDDGFPAYNPAVVVHDAAQQIAEALGGADPLARAPRRPAVLGR